ncbi:MAG: type III-B CRISPR module RAMP protein Cmr4 [Gammaproteobacteria bacterium]
MTTTATTNTPPTPRLYWLHALTPLHVGAGQGIGFIDLPVMREKVTGWPLVPGSSFKGVLRDAYAAQCKTDPFKAAFGKPDEAIEEEDNTKDDSAQNSQSGQDTTPQSENAGSLVFSDARLICLPVRSLLGTFAWVTAPMVLHRLYRDLDAAGQTSGLAAHCKIEQDDIAHITDRGKVLDGDGQRLYLEDLDFKTETCSTATQWADAIGNWLFHDDPVWQSLFAERFTIVADDVFNFLCETATEVNARIKINSKTGTAAGNALWYEESLPAETLLAGLVWCDRVYGYSGTTPQQLMDDYCAGECPLQIGGKASIGKGRVRCCFVND